jgi:ribosomal protein S18 acetylase RimI-like enzyme
MPELLSRIRSFSTEDLGELHEIDRICFPAHISFSRSELFHHLNHSKSITRVAEVPGRIIGFVVARLERGNRAHIITLDVIPDARKQKVGTMLMNEMHCELEKIGVRTVFLEVETGNLPAQRLYQGLRYQYVGLLERYYHGCEDAYRMARMTDPVKELSALENVAVE